MKLIGVDIGGSHISAAKVILGDRVASFDCFQEADVDTFGSKEAIISAWTEVVRKAAGESINYQVGIAMPGPYDYDNGISLIKEQGKMASLYQLSVKNLLAESLGIPASQIAFTNDAEAFLSGESYAGAGRDFQNSIGITLGTGLGSAIKIHDVVKDAKLWTAPFRDGIAEDYLGTAWFKKYAFEKFGLEISGVKDLLSPDFDLDATKNIFETFGRALGEFLFPYLIRLHSEGVVLGGKISLASENYLPSTQSYLETMGYPVSFTISELGERAALIGACLPFLEK
ncbi:ROK family protein [Algoriphagus sp. D3-2-R+10]|uniref:ROK family protein n=1 Tax=Algoriphagus aurantiacus TaxID=3103948 RepID=UPI002B3BD59A|nr:ROK family protein [Algoriphagus sp. D3-2-R+10]MEB2776272.1 ROK family protein [Algoriphagus sp. D3-2-R+10]